MLSAQVDRGLLLHVLLLLLLGLLHLSSHHNHSQLLLHHKVVLLYEVTLLSGRLRCLCNLFDMLNFTAQLMGSFCLFEILERSIE